MEVTLKNYRCFPDSKPASFEIGRGLTAFIGINNAGKSALLKFFHEFRPLFQVLSHINGTFQSAMHEPNPPQSFAISSVYDIEEIFSDANNRDIELVFRFSRPAVEDDPALLLPRSLEILIPRATNTFKARLDVGDGFSHVSGTWRLASRFVIPGNKEIEFAPMFKEFEALSHGIYFGPFRNAINIGTNADYFDIRIGQAFIDQWRTFKTGKIKQHNQLILKVTEDIRRIFEFHDLQIDASQETQTLQLFINHKSYKLPEVGSGLAQFIMVLGNAAIRKPSFIFIDEPELNLHPSLMLDFLTTLSSYAQTGVMFATHSIGLARATSDRIYSIRRNEQSVSEIRRYEVTPRLAEFLGELSFSGYQELGFDKVLLVEGPNDLRVVQQFLRFYRIEHKVLLLPLGGSTLINTYAEEQLLEVKRIAKRVFALIDSERVQGGAQLSAERRGFVEACKRADVIPHVLERRAIENYLTDNAVKSAKGEKFSALKPFDKLNHTSPTWAKSDNWRIAAEMTPSDITDTDLGVFLQKIADA